MDPFAQTRTSQGAVPCRRVEPVNAQGPCELATCTSFRFDPVAAQDLAAWRAERAQGAVSGGKSMGLLELAMCVSQQQGHIEVFRESLLSFARATGPLFASDDGAGVASAPRQDGLITEPLFAWSSAALMASLALVLQEIVNGSMPVKGAAVLGNLVKRHVRNPQTGAEFDLITISRLIDTAYACDLADPAFMRREERDGRITYTFMLREDMEQASVVDMIVASFEREMSLSDYLMMSQVLEFGDEVDAAARERFALTDDRPAPAADADYGFAAVDNLLGAEEPLDEDDKPAVASLVHALVAAHLLHARVDVFSADENTGHLRFPTYLGWLWYDFSCRLDVARIGYCARCRKPFSLVGHRGIDRRFCSEACKTAAKNERTRNRRNALREAFLAGEGVAALAHRYYPDETAAAGGAKVRRELETWPKLKHEVDDAIEAEGWHAGLLARCRAEGLTVERLLSTRRREELKAMVARAHV